MAPQSVQWLLELGPLWSAWRFKAFSGAKKVQEVQVRISIVFVHHMTERGCSGWRASLPQVREEQNDDHDQEKTFFVCKKRRA